MRLASTLIALLLFLAITACSIAPPAPTDPLTEPSVSTSSETIPASSGSVSSSTSSEASSTSIETTESSTSTTVTRTSSSTTATTTKTSSSPTSSTSTSTTSKKTTIATTTTTASQSDPYAAYPNNDLSWWYVRPAPGKRATIDSGVQTLINKYGAIWQLAPGPKVVYLTMDEGYEFEANTSEILNIAAEKNVPITFFITGGYLQNNLGLVQRMIREGHQVGNHTQRHLRASEALAISTQTFINDIVELEQNYLSMVGRPIPKLYRPPEGGYSERSLKVAKDLGYTTVFWSFAYRDWLTDDQPDPAVAFELIMNELHDGSILLLHAVSDTNVEILPKLIDAIRAEGYTFALLQP